MDSLQEELAEAVRLEKLLKHHRDGAKSALVLQKKAMPRLRMIASSCMSAMEGQYPLVQEDLLALGLELEKSKRVRTGPPGAPTELRARTRAGAVTVLWRSPMRRSIFTIQYAEGSPQNGWHGDGSAFMAVRARFIFKPTTRGVLYWFRVKAMNPNGESAWSTSISVRAV